VSDGCGAGSPTCARFLRVVGCRSRAERTSVRVNTVKDILFSSLPKAGAQLPGPPARVIFGLRVMGWRSRFWSGAPLKESEVYF